MKPAPHYLASSASAIDSALQLARLTAADRVVDLGCGDGAILAAAADFAGSVVGVEIDEILAARARDRLHPYGDKCRIVETDIFDCDLAALDPTVVFAFLTRATLQRLARRLTVLNDGVRVVTLEMPVPGWECKARAPGGYLYELPVRQRPARGTEGWPVAGFHLTLPANEISSFSLVIAHPAGVPAFALSPSLAGIGTVATGADRLAEPGSLAVDVQWRPQPGGTRRAGTLTGAAIGALTLRVTYDSSCPAAEAVPLR